MLTVIRAYWTWIAAVGLLALLACLREIYRAQRSRVQTIFGLERELAATREARARLTMLAILVLLAALALLRYGIVPSYPLPPLLQPTATQIFIPLPTSTPVTPTPTRTRIPTRPRPTSVQVSETPTSTAGPAPPCSQPGVCITFPAPGQVVTGQITIRGTASIDAFQFYKVEYGLGEEPQQWHSIGDMQRTPVVSGVLGEWNTSGFPAGAVRLRLTVVDTSGNFPPPHEVRVVAQP